MCCVLNELQVNVRESFDKFTNMRRDQIRKDGWNHAHAQPAAHSLTQIGQRVLRHGYLLQDAQRRLAQGFSKSGEPYGTAHAFEQGSSDLFLQRPYLL